MRLARPALSLLAVAAFALATALPPATAYGQDGGKPPAPPPQDKPEAAQPGPKPDDGDVVRILPQDGGWKVEDLFKHIHRTTGKSILYDSGPTGKVKSAKVEFIGEYAIRRSELFDWLQAVLSYCSLVLVPVGPKGPDGEQQWFCLDQANAMVKTRPVYIDEDDIPKYADRDGLYVVTSVTLKHISDTQRVRTALQPLSTTTAGIGRVQDIQGSRALILGDFAPVVAAMKRLLDYIDQENPRIEPRMEVVELKFAVASELEPIITDLIESSDQPGRQQPRQQGQPEEEPQPKIIPDDRLDALIIYATDRYMGKIKTLITQLDVPTKARGRLHFVPLRHTDAEETADLLEELVDGASRSASGTTRTARSSRTNRATPTTAPAAGGPGGPFGGTGTEGQPVIIPDKSSNSLIIHASPTQFEHIAELIEQLDTSRPQVLIETILVELGLSDTLALGTELFSSNDDIAVDTDGDGTADAITEARKFFGATGFGLSETVTQDVGGVILPTGRSPILGTGLTAGIFKNGKLPVLISLFQSSGRAKILTMPSLVTNDNRKASLRIKRTTSYRENVRDDTGTNTDSFQQVDAESELTISPHISSDNYLRLEISQTVSNFGTRPSPDAPPDQTERSVETEVTLPDAYTVVLGGLIQDEERSSVSKVPILGDIPVIGFFFRQTEDTSSPGRLFVFVTPRILRDMENFTDYHKLTWERKLLSSDLFGEDIQFPVENFHGPAAPESAAEKLRRLEKSGALSGARLKAPPTDEERRQMAEREARRAAGAAEPAPAPAAETK